MTSSSPPLIPPTNGHLQTLNSSLLKCCSAAWTKWGRCRLNALRLHIGEMSLQARVIIEMMYNVCDMLAVCASWSKSFKFQSETNLVQKVKETKFALGLPVMGRRGLGKQCEHGIINTSKMEVGKKTAVFSLFISHLSHLQWLSMGLLKNIFTYVYSLLKGFTISALLRM